MKKIFANPYFLIFWLFIAVICMAQVHSYDYTLTIKVEGKSLEQSMKIKQELTEYCKKNGISIEDYSKKEFDSIQRSRSMKIFK